MRGAFGRGDLACLKPEGDGLLGARGNAPAQGRREQGLGVLGEVVLRSVVRGFTIGSKGRDRATGVHDRPRRLRW